MKIPIEEVVTHFAIVSPLIEFEDLDVLQKVLDSFGDYDAPVQQKYYYDCIMARYNDVMLGRTEITDEGLQLSSDSSICELPVEVDTYETCIHSFILRIKDIMDKDLCNLQTMSFEAMAEVTGAVIGMGDLIDWR